MNIDLEHASGNTNTAKEMTGEQRCVCGAHYGHTGKHWPKQEFVKSFEEQVKDDAIVVSLLHILDEEGYKLQENGTGNFGERAINLIDSLQQKGKWLIWSIEHAGWWAPNHHGYVLTRKAAGRYTYEEALEIVRKANEFHQDIPFEAMVLDNEIDHD